MSAGTATCIGTKSSNITVGGDRNYEVAYRVITTDRDDQGIAAMMASGIPSIGEHYAIGNNYDLGAHVKSYSASLQSESDSGKVWIVTVSFSTAGNTTDPTGSQGMFYDFPWLKPASISGSGSKVEQLATAHYANPSGGTPEVLVNSANKPLDDVYKEETAHSLSIHIAFKFADFTPKGAGAYADCVNENVFFGGPQDYWKMAAPRWALLYTGEGIPYWDVQFDFEGKFNFWNENSLTGGLYEFRKPDEGYYYREALTGGGFVVKKFTDDYLHPISGKGRLDGSGGKQDWQDPPAHFPSYGINLYLRKDFSELAIPTSVDDIIKGVRNG